MCLEDLILTDLDTIFVGIAGMNEVDIVQTIENALEMAERPELLSFGVWNHNTFGVDLTYKHPQVRVVNVHYPISLGLGVARACVSALYNGEKYYYQIDAHMLFQKNWDSILVSSHKKIEQVAEKPIISYFGQMWWTDEDNNICGYDPDADVIGLPITYSDEHRSFGLPINVGHPNGARMWEETSSDFLEHYNIQGGFLFTKAEFLTEVGYDPQLMFFGEELLLAMRAWTRGYRIFVIKPPVQWHKDRWGSKKHPQERDLVENTQRPPSTPEGAVWDQRQAESMRRVQAIFRGDILGFWGAPTKELLDQYLEVSKLGKRMNLSEFTPFTKDLE
jgi:hypothetical protein